MKWPDLAIVKAKTVEKVKENKEKLIIEELLKPVDNLKLEDGSSDVCSEISDVFEEFHKNSQLKLQPEGYLTKHEADIRTIDGFSKSFKDTMQELREPKMLEDENAEKLALERKIVKIEVTLDELDEPIPPVEEQPESSNANTFSAVWDLLEKRSHDNRKTFQVTPLNFNAFRQKNHAYWLQREPVSWEELEKSRERCEQWLEDNFEF